ncbi:hypothetical protein CDL12_29559 [Handroanthus impetiginosus]|uniref:EF-hand domain-containing protein n=1 Tax=Handroanthus impetiginosus TaxID=429701 RepID=A0A2G9FY25_9LAMI|nr:hypothetical protein CDL12_29559 [Handroanthus impetiginosus]
MEELRDIAIAHYRASSPEVQVLAYDFFKTMDTDGDRRVDLSEFLAFMRQQGYSQMRSPSFFNVLDHHGNGTLGFFEVMTVYYIIKSGRPFCDSCGNFIPGIFFSCVECYKTPELSFNLCHDCYRSTKCKHNHDGRVQFLDNYTLLEAKRNPSLAHAIDLNSNQTTISNGNIQVPRSNVSMNATYPTTMTATDPTYPPNPSPNYSNAIIPATSFGELQQHQRRLGQLRTKDKWLTGLKAFEVALSVGNISSTMCTIL